MTKNAPEWFKEGATVRVIKEIYGHLYKEGEVIVLEKVNEYEPINTNAMWASELLKIGHGNNRWWVVPEEVEPLKKLTLEEIIGG